MTNIPEITLLTWASFGIVVDKVSESDTELKVYISVPEHSENKDIHGNEMAGTHLAQRAKTTLTEMGVKNLIVLSRIIKGLYWTKDMGNAAKNKIGKQLYRSQWDDEL